MPPLPQMWSWYRRRATSTATRTGGRPPLRPPSSSTTTAPSGGGGASRPGHPPWCRLPTSPSPCPSPASRAPRYYPVRTSYTAQIRNPSMPISRFLAPRYYPSLPPYPLNPSNSIPPCLSLASRAPQHYPPLPLKIASTLCPSPGSRAPQYCSPLPLISSYSKANHASIEKDGMCAQRCFGERL